MRLASLVRHPRLWRHEQIRRSVAEDSIAVDRVDDGERLTTVPDRSQDFVIASHFLEHCEDPVGTLAAHLRVLRPGGALALPDRHRDATTLEHLVADHEQGPEASRAGHYREWARLVDLPLGNIDAAEVEAHAAALEGRGYSIHFHCWTDDEFLVAPERTTGQTSSV
jgi:ubiquinone/menaquinone biosynthesis C-methylase UbiE